MAVAKERQRFAEERAPDLPAAVGGRGDVVHISKRVHAVGDDEWLTVVVGSQEGRKCDLTLAYGLGAADGRRVRLVLPHSQSGATLHRSAWLKRGKQPEIYTYRGARAPEPAEMPTRGEARSHYACWISPRTSDRDAIRDADYRRASLPHHLGSKASWVHDLVEAVSAMPDVDPGHRRGYRAWLYCGQQVLHVHAHKGGLLVSVGIQNADNRIQWELAGAMTRSDVERALGQIEVAKQARATGDFHKEDEHWLQSVIGRDPQLVRVEGRIHREVPAWRRSGNPKPAPRKGAWGRGYIDLLGLDAHGTIQIVETKLASNDDPMLALQGLDYYAFCEAFRRPLTHRLDVSPGAPMAVRYVVGGTSKKLTHVNAYATATFEALDFDYDKIGITGWFHTPARQRSRVRTFDLEL